ncbi:NAD-binding Rossmann fold oxidoreductase family protein [Lindgomyces ingoldianus]|uniref:NAD-binding Rossmann fold oxidoreductase family protein n=1 Tax=Lindgomyces ingoldianus TaxID=673940 RepID=A0ACB6QUM9_9PLEO|nr:NAD-binding Rossmann fold oxidoreductase family protein [Lindgomyces ingoldianus]KAF2469896.1 NAD-binding Rossmann fold oxidoreductase family protein [Lindgomyces ingoldianus]
MASPPKSIGLIGLSAKGSWASRSHLSYLQSTPFYKITALQNSSKSAAEAAASTYSLTHVHTYDNPAALATDPSVSIVAVSVNVPGHYESIRPALFAGKDLFVEWPLARNLADAEELTAIAKEKGVRTLVGLQARNNPTIIAAKKIVESGKLGRILGTSMYGHGAIFGSTIVPDFEYALPVENGANILTIPFGHAVDALCFVLGEFAELSATLANLRPELSLVGNDGKEVRKVKKTAHDHVSVTGTLVNGGGVVDVVYAGGQSRTGRSFHWEINGVHGSLVLEGKAPTMGHVQMFQPTLKFFDIEGKEENVEVEKAGDWDKGDFSFNVGRAWDAWAGKGLEKGYTVTTFEDAVVRHRMVEAIYRSAEKGTRESYL